MCNDARSVQKGAKSMADRREQRRLDTRRRLLDAAEHVFSQKGYQEVSVLDITEAANVSKRTFYLHFPDKEAVIEALALRGFEELRAQVETEKWHNHPHPNMASFRAGFQQVTQTIFEYVASKPDLMQIVFGRGGSFRLQTMAREFMVRAWVENLERECHFRPDAAVAPEVLANAMAGVIYQLMCWWWQNPNPFSPADMAAQCASIVYDGVGVNLTLEDETTPC
jgi:AcrR family transcriptional regulator